MAYISTKDVKKMRTAIRQTFPTKDGWKWSVTIMDNNAGVTIALVQYPMGYTFPPSLIVDYHNPAATCDEHDISGKEKDTLVQAGDILTRDWWNDRIDDYTAITFYASLRIGTWEQNAVQLNKLAQD